MPEQKPPADRLQPALLDRLTDDQPDTKHEPIEAKGLSKRGLRQSVLRDLAWLFNATRLETSEEMSSAPYVRSSVVNFGLPPLSGKGVSSLDSTDLTRPIPEAVLTFQHPTLPP